MKGLTLLTGKDCHLCDQARSLLSEFSHNDMTFDEVDIYAKRIYLDKYWDKIPVLLLGERELLWPFDAELIKYFLD
ncbi:glutaredoxin family protein [Gammaproteobacteria bacterium]|nr:glutaredoxin family protein [Gammaproteobacteria bacterium]